MTAFELCGIYDGQAFKLKNGRKVWEHIKYQDGIDKCLVSRVIYDDNEKGGKPFMLGLRMAQMYINPDSEIEIVSLKE